MTQVPTITERVGFVLIDREPGGPLLVETPAGLTTARFAAELRGALADAYKAGRGDGYLARRGEQVIDADALDMIAANLTGREWEAADLDTVARLVIGTGRVIALPDADLVFTSTSGDHARHNGPVTAVRELGPDENETPEAIFECVDGNGVTFHAWQSELTLDGQRSVPPPRCGSCADELRPGESNPCPRCLPADDPGAAFSEPEQVRECVDHGTQLVAQWGSSYSHTGAGVRWWTLECGCVESEQTDGPRSVPGCTCGACVEALGDGR